MDPPLRLIALVHHHMTAEGRRGTKSKEENEQNTWEKGDDDDNEMHEKLG